MTKISLNMDFNLKRGRSPQDTLPFKNHRMVQKAKDPFFLSRSLEVERTDILSRSLPVLRPLVDRAVYRSTLTKQTNLRRHLLNSQRNTSSCHSDWTWEPIRKLKKRKSEIESDLIPHGSRMGSMCIVTALQGIYWEVTLHVYSWKIKAEIK